MEKVLTTKNGVNLFVTYDGEEVKSFITDGKKEEIWDALWEDMVNTADLTTLNMATMLYVLTKRYGIIEQLFLSSKCLKKFRKCTNS